MDTAVEGMRSRRGRVEFQPLSQPSPNLLHGRCRFSASQVSASWPIAGSRTSLASLTRIILTESPSSGLSIWSKKHRQCLELALLRHCAMPVKSGMRGISDVSPRINALVGSFFERVGAAIFDLLLIPRARVPSRQRCTQRVARRSSSATPRSTRSSGRARAFMRGVRGRPQRATTRERAPRRAPRPQPRWPSFWLSI